MHDADGNFDEDESSCRGFAEDRGSMKALEEMETLIEMNILRMEALMVMGALMEVV